MWWCSIIIITTVFNKAPTDSFLPYPAEVSQATPLRTPAPILTAHLTAHPQGSASRFIQFWLNSVISHQQSDVGKTKGKASNYLKLSEISFWVLRTKQERKSKGEGEHDGRDREFLNGILHLVTFPGWDINLRYGVLIHPKDFYRFHNHKPDSPGIKIKLKILPLEEPECKVQRI